MLRPIDLISTDPGVEWLSRPRLSLDEYRRQARSHVSRIDEAKQTLAHICLPFRGNGTISSVRCVDAVSTLNKLSNYVKQFCALLEETSRLPLALLALRYENLYLCYQINEQVDRLRDLITTYRKTNSSSRSSHRKDIYHASQDILQLIADLSQRVADQEQSARFQEKRLLSAYEEASK